MIFLKGEECKIKKIGGLRNKWREESEIKSLHGWKIGFKDGGSISKNTFFI